MDSLGKLITTFKIPKKQSSVNRITGVSSYYVIDGELIFIFVDVVFKGAKSYNLILFKFDKDLSGSTIRIPTDKKYK